MMSSSASSTTTSTPPASSAESPSSRIGDDGDTASPRRRRRGLNDGGTEHEDPTGDVVVSDGNGNGDGDSLPRSWEDESASMVRRALREMAAAGTGPPNGGDDDRNGDDDGMDDDDDDGVEGGDRGDNGDGDPPPPPREHSYLEASHPLLPEGPSSSAVDLPDDDDDDDDDGAWHRRRRTLELAVLELPGVVLFPGQTVPVRLRDRATVRYVGRQIHACRTRPDVQPTVRLGILTHRDDDDEYGGPPFVGGSGAGSSSSSSRRSMEERRRRGSRMRRQRPLLPPLLIRRGSQGGRVSIVRLQDEFLPYGDDDHDDDHHDDDNDNDTDGQRGRVHPFVGRIGTIATVKQTHERTSSQPMLESQPSNNDAAAAATPPPDGGGGGAQRSHASSGVWGRYEDASELVFTAVGTGRFRIVGCVDSGGAGGWNNNGVVSSGGGNVFLVEELKDRPLPRPPIQRPFASVVPWPNADAKAQDRDDDDDDDGGDDDDDDSDAESESNLAQNGIFTSLRRQSQLACNLSQLTPVPYFVYKNLSPWSLVEKIVTLLKSSDGRGNLPSLGNVERKNLDPMRFSFWMANNAPFTERERLVLLRMHSVLERLIFIWKAVDRLSKQESVICCTQCKSRFTTVTDIFTVAGAEGTTAAYVNDHGCIHQITTLRTIDERKVLFHGSPSTDNSYFPGYSWLITSCRRCASHLGWKFQKVPTRPSSSSPRSSQGMDSPDRPTTFYGFMSSNVVTAQL